MACGDEEALREKKKTKDGKFVGQERLRITWEALESGRMDYEAFCGRVQDVAGIGQGAQGPREAVSGDDGAC